jgi:uncharacterized membrane protein
VEKLFKLLMHRVVRCFVAGTLSILPVALTAAIVVWLGNFLWQCLGPGTLVGESLRNVGLRFAANQTVAYCLGAVVVVAVVFAIGVVVESGARNLVQRIIDAAMKRIPLVGNLYGTSKQLVGLFDKSDPKKLQGMSAVYCHFGSGCSLLALLVSSDRYRINDRDCHAVIIPTSPVPVGGGLFFMPVDSVEPANVSIEALMSIYVSMGVSAAQFLPPGKKDEG